MNHLFHGSGYRNNELKPGIHYTGKLVQWDKTESNEWLYASSCPKDATEQGFFSTIEKKYDVSRSRSSGSELIIEFRDKVPTVQEIHNLPLFLYVIGFDKDIWQKVNNQHNGLTTEYKTKEIIDGKHIITCDKIEVKRFLNGRNLKLISSRSSFNW